MAELNLGTKFECYNCGTRFYDLGKSEPVCPKCGANQKDSDRGESSTAAASTRRKRKVEPVKPVEVDEDVPVDELPDDAIAEEIDADLAADDEEEEDLDDEE
jgi:uncharacterized protein (TIGR02300 family)